ncbi:LmeA family phospholipid-binding protein [Streptomyces sp. NPDC048606]|uniref:LmeA family phospholipid-binding protein n=1 Tax=Streptomyces sp. NPDC048606 TaxID=3154726 RepID=UPI003440FA7E
MPSKATPSPVPPTTPRPKAARTAPPRRPSRRVLRVAVATLLAGALLLAADALARQVGEERFADRIAARQNADVNSPKVTIEGCPFLLDAARGSHPEVRVTADARTPDGIPVKAAVDLHKVAKSPAGYTAASADAAFTAPFDALGPDGDRAVRLSDAGDGRLRMETAVMGMPLVVTAGLRLDAGVVTLHAESATLAGRRLPADTPAIERTLSAQSRRLPPLPLGLTPTTVTVGPDGVTAHAEAGRVSLA